MKNLNIRTKLYIGLLSVVFFVIISMIATYERMHRLDQLKSLDNQLTSIQKNYLSVRLMSMQYINSHKETEGLQSIQKMEQLMTALSSLDNSFDFIDEKGMRNHLAIYQEALINLHQGIKAMELSKAGLNRLYENIIQEVDQLRADGFPIDVNAYIHFLKTRMLVYQYYQDLSGSTFSESLSAINTTIEDTRKSGNMDMIKQLAQYKSYLHSIEDTQLKLQEVRKLAYESSEKLNQLIIKERESIADHISVIYRNMKRVMIIGFFAIIIIMLLIRAYVIKPISTSLENSVKLIEKLAKGKLNNLISGENLSKSDEIGRLACAVKCMQERWSGVIKGIESGIENILRVVEKLNTTSQQVSSGAAEQAASIEEVSASIEELNSSIFQNSDNAKASARVSEEASQNLMEVNRRATEAFHSSEDINDKISIIQDIAFQTNILALNAAVEAARAGEKGKGFAVVADEVRKLAEHSREASDEIIELSQKNSVASKKAGESLSAVVPMVETTKDSMKDIAGTTLEQQNGVEQISHSVMQLNDISQQNASISEEMALGSEELEEQAQCLKQSIAYFEM